MTLFPKKGWNSIGSLTPKPTKPQGTLAKRNNNLPDGCAASIHPADPASP